MPWLEKLLEFESVDQMRAMLLAQNPAFSRKSLNKVVVVGAADEGLRFIQLCEEHAIEVVAVFDDHSQKIGLQIGRHNVNPMEMLEDVDRATPVIIASHRVLKGVERLKEMGFKYVAPFALLEVLDPMTFPPHMFYRGWLEDLFGNRARYIGLSKLLADKFSLQVLDALLGFRLTFDATFLSPIVEWDLYKPKGILSYSDNEVYVDGGSYDGDTIRLFIDRVHGQFSRVLAFEPDRKTYERLVEKFSGEKRVEPINAGLHRRKGRLKFDNMGTRASTFVEQGGVEISVVGLDEVLGEQRVTFVKMNIEGSEIAALKGAERSINKWAPKLAISAYHHPPHLWQVPELVNRLRSDYRLYLRQHDGGVVETVLYALA